MNLLIIRIPQIIASHTVFELSLLRMINHTKPGPWRKPETVICSAVSWVWSSRQASAGQRRMVSDSKEGFGLTWSGAKLKTRKELHRVVVEGNFRKGRGGEMANVLNCVSWNIKCQSNVTVFMKNSGVKILVWKESFRSLDDIFKL